MERTARWLTALACLAAATLLFACAALSLQLEDDVVSCEEALVAVPEPPGWRAWTPEANDPQNYRVGEFDIHFGLSAPKYWMGYHDVSLVEPGVCPRQGASVDPWFADGDSPGSGFYRHPYELTVRRSLAGDAYVVSGRRSEKDPDVFVTAFRRQKEHRLALASYDAAELLGIDVPLLALVLVAMVRAGRQLSLARRLGDPRSFEEGTADAQGTIRIRSETVTAPEGTRVAAGPVLLDIARRDGGSYRLAPSVRAARVFEGTRERAARAARTRAVRALLFAIGVVVLAAAGLVAWCVHAFLTTPIY